MLKFNGKTMKKAVVAEEFTVEDENFCISRTGGHDSVMAKPGMELWIISEAECESYGSTEMSLCWIPKFGFATTLASKFVDYIPTESTEEREALDMTGATSRQTDSLANNSESPNSSEWKNGDECVFDNKTKREFDNPLLGDEYPNQNAIVHHTFKNKHKFDMVLIEFEDGHCAAVMQECISKPETPEQKAERERLEAAYDLYCYAKKESVYSCVIVSFKEFIGGFSAREREEYLAIVDKTGYRKAK